MFISPGIKPNHKIIKLAKINNITIVGDLDIFWQIEKNKNRFIFITGSNGKSTVTSLIHHLLISAKKLYYWRQHRFTCFKLKL